MWPACSGITFHMIDVSIIPGTGSSWSNTAVAAGCGPVVHPISQITGVPRANAGSSS